MKDPNGFDELARRKLAERDHAFDPSHWADMERLLADRERKPKAWWPWLTAGALLMAGGASWYAMNELSAPVTSEDTRIIEAPATKLVVPEAIPVTAPLPTAPMSTEQPDRPVNDPQAAGSTHYPGSTTETRSGIKRPRATRRAEEPAHRNGNIPSDGPTEKPATTIVTAATAQPSTSTSPARAINTTRTEDGLSIVPVLATTDAIGIPLPEAQSTPIDPMRGTETEQQAVDQAPGSVPEPEALVTEHKETTGEKHEPEEGATSKDAEANTPEPAAVSPAPPLLTEWLAIRSSAELTLLGGAFSTTGTYTGKGTEHWSASTERRITMGCGLESMWKLGEHFGLGSGIHFSSYRERLRSEELARTDADITSSYHWTTFDTLVLTVVDTVIIGAVQYFETVLQPTTVYELERTLDTAYSTTILRQSRTMTNTVDYLEIPLFVDAHTSCGRWVFGVRGGPTFGLLTSHEATIPGESEDGYTTLGKEDFRSMTLGCSARAYARYRLNSVWSIGLEPTWRQQLGNAFGDTEVQRRGSGFGGYVGISYRIASKSAVP